MFDTRKVTAGDGRVHVVIVGQGATLCGLAPTGEVGEGDTAPCAECATDWRARGEEPRMVQRTRVAIQPLDARTGQRHPPLHAGPSGRREPGRHG